MEIKLEDTALGCQATKKIKFQVAINTIDLNKLNDIKDKIQHAKQLTGNKVEEVVINS